MPPNTKHVFYVKTLADQTFADLLAERSDVRLDRLENEHSRADAASVLTQAHGYQISSARDELAPHFHITADLLAQCPNLLVVSTHGAGFDTVDVDACTAAGVLAVNQAGGNREAVAEHVIGMMLCLSKRIIQVDRAIRREVITSREQFMGNDVIGRTIGIVGIGHVGSRVAELAKGLFRMKVLAYDPYLSAPEIAARGGEKVELEELLRRSDYVSINCPRTAETTNMIGAAQYAMMQPHAYFITTARGGIHDEMALADALKAGRLAGAGLDVWFKEPPPLDHPLLQFDNVLVSPHTAGVTKEARTNIATIAAEQMLEVLDGKRPPRLLNPEVWPAYARRYESIFGIAPEG